MQLYNTLTHKKEPLTPVRPGKINMYVCGITAYDYCHIGHARSALVFDVLACWLRHKGLDVNFIRNFTDIDDKIINRAQQEHRPWRDVAQTYMQAFHEDMDILGVQRADHEPCATDYIPHMQALCVKLIDMGKAYATISGDVYFRVRSWPEYGKLSGRSLDDLQAGARIAVGEEKEDPLDFALWKATKEGEPFWESPWGKGRPGWHIECSAMSEAHLPLDIHGGGLDLVFPHHENEIAQTEAATGMPLARMWVHNGFVQVNAEKMSKSLGNFKTIRQILHNYMPETLRFFLLGKHYRSPIDFTDASMDEAEKAQKRVYECLAEVQTACANTSLKPTPLPAEYSADFKEHIGAFTTAMDDDCNTAAALGHVFALVRWVNRVLEDKALRRSEQAIALLKDFVQHMAIWGGILGLFQMNPQQFLQDLRTMRTQRHTINIAQVEALMQERDAARKAKDFAKADAVRESLAHMGIALRDTPGGAVWDLA